MNRQKTKPRPNRIRQMCNMLEAAAKKHHVRVNMLEPTIRLRASDNPCKTICCHGGLFALAMEEKNDYRFLEGNLTENKFGMATTVFFDEGADMMARFLGFCDSNDLREWAEINANIWGNPYGKNMFHAGKAFGLYRGIDDPMLKGICEPTVEDILKHWRDVAKRIEENERSQI